MADALAAARGPCRARRPPPRCGACPRRRAPGCGCRPAAGLPSALAVSPAISMPWSTALRSRCTSASRTSPSMRAVHAHVRRSRSGGPPPCSAAAPCRAPRAGRRRRRWRAAPAAPRPRGPPACDRLPCSAVDAVRVAAHEAEGVVPEQVEVALQLLQIALRSSAGGVASARTAQEAVPHAGEALEDAPPTRRRAAWPARSPPADRRPAGPASPASPR